MHFQPTSRRFMFSTGISLPVIELSTALRLLKAYLWPCPNMLPARRCGLQASGTRLERFIRPSAKNAAKRGIYDNSITNVASATMREHLIDRKPNAETVKTVPLAAHLAVLVQRAIGCARRDSRTLCSWMRVRHQMMPPYAVTRLAQNWKHPHRLRTTTGCTLMTGFASIT